MVDRRVTDGKRIAQLLASELTGLDTGPLSAIEVADADPDVEPSDGGTFAYAIERAGERVGSVHVHEDRARIDLLRADSTPEIPHDSIEVAGGRDDAAVTLWVESGAAVKRALDALVDTLASESD